MGDPSGQAPTAGGALRPGPEPVEALGAGPELWGNLETRPQILVSLSTGPRAGSLGTKPRTFGVLGEALGQGHGPWETLKDLKTF